MDKKEKPKSKSGLLATLIILSMMIGGAIGFSIGSGMFLELNEIQKTLLGFDKQIIEILP